MDFTIDPGRGRFGRSSLPLGAGLGWFARPPVRVTAAAMAGFPVAFLLSHLFG
ncbi:hypothetical protein [Aquibium sp. ELW1220]|uniref:hypothetical protein n=1 Tax=Aquibium sp. ELW1220 TaxID=2976766 RepID=UPI0025B1E715|nr:hypothetical protein [Aquibium sp. ELW1220]MDN2578561.1 hypothetical protein [Aquibium sp. ELW1220]